ncbi:probable disease resistance protein At1g61300 [Lolium perenne]|uniref:probable disease resistance protein At1g61300 n=1 Tax=Lolium perenne TaxID=4522 RepID=UPI0021F503B7|nr:probable disease resistance protein At1g61300 [Lolium perenne]XP_051228307.1 probable disease resistance protein At1g61300 [Lolium perenne]XP_051228308.1 probable disease resistance protein At1g61300 [Lolium perenne]XP_051228309.1 probable disease resistance protein At1g61300 [Lolium perenne]
MATNLGSWFGATISTVTSPLRDIFVTHASYCLNTGNNVRAHERVANTLKGKQAAVEGEIEAGIPNGFIKTEEAGLWLNRAKEAISNVEKNRERYDKRSRTFSCCYLNCWANYKIGKRAAKEISEVEACAESIPHNATVKGPPPFVIDIPIQSAQLPSQESIHLNAYQCITRTDDPVGMIGIWGPDGVSNTHLLKKINNSFVGDSSYFVIFVTASRECSVQRIQAQILQRLEIRNDGDVVTQATNISKLLRIRNFLVLVDDLYEKLDLTEVGIPYPLGTVGDYKRKVLITSQSETVCVQMDVNKYIEVPCLDEIEALKLFAQNVGQEDIDSDPQIRALAKDLVKEIKGVPSDLIHYGKQMGGKRDPREWEDVIQAVRKLNLQKKDPTFAGRTLKNLEDSAKNLHARKTDVRCRIEVAERLGMTSTNEVDRWLEKVDAISSDVQIIFEGNKLNKNVTMEAVAKLSEVQECLRSCPNSDNIALVSVPPPAQEIPGPSMPTENHNLQKALQFIEDDPVGMIGIWGQGGVGKTYLLNSINNSIAVAGGISFNVIFVTASRGCSVQTVQGDILKKLGMERAGDVESQGQKIYNFLRNRSFILLLDDLWEQIDLQAVGVPYPLGTVNQLKRKVVLTTRSKKVCGEMDVRKELKVTCLQEDDAWQLFKEKVTQDTLSSSPRIEALARELVKELKGLPLALIVVGRAMYPKIQPSDWEYAIKQLQQSCCDEDDLLSMENVFRQLKFSYDSLRNDTLRRCFLTCALWPEDWEIMKADLAQCWLGLGLVDGDIQSSYTKAYSLMSDLRDACLLENQGNWYGFVKVHDVIRDMAIWISCGCGENNNNWFVRAKVGREDKFSIPWSKAEYISLMLNEMRKLSPFRLDPCPMKLRMLCLQNNYFDGSIAETIKNFTALTYLDLRSNLLKNIPDELCSLANLEYLDLSHNPDIYQLPYCFRSLVKLKFLYLLCTDIRIIPYGIISNLKVLQVIDLRSWRAYHGGGSLNYNPTLFQEFGTLDQLKAVGIEADGFTEYESLRDATNLPIRSLILGSLKETDAFCLSDILSADFARCTLYELEIIQSNIEQITVRQEPNYQFPTLNKLSLWFLVKLKEITWVGRPPSSVFPTLTCVDVNSCSKLEHLSWVMYLPCLEQLEARFCNNMKEAFLRTGHQGEIMSMDQENPRTFPCLKHLCLSDNAKLVTICGPHVTFPFLEELVLTKSPELISLPFKTNSLPLKLQELRVDNIECWDRLQCEDGVKSFLQPTLKFGYETEMP